MKIELLRYLEMSKNEICEKIIEILDDIIGVRIEANDDLKLNGIDSLSIVNLIVGVEEEFKIIFSDDDLNPDILKTIYDIA